MRRRTVDPRALALAAVMTAVVFVLTSMVRVPTPAKGYIHLGDAGVFFSALAFGPWIGAVAGGLGTGLADVAGGYPQWALFSFVIHGLQGLVTGWFARKWQGIAGLLVGVAAGAAIVVVGYFGAGILLSGFGAAVGELPMNVIQVLGGAVVAVPLFLAVRQAYPPITRWGGRRR